MVRINGSHTAEILDKVAALSVSNWTCKDDDPDIRQVGPMAQDFHAALGLGATSTGISTLGTSGVALASIKALHEQLSGAHSQIEKLDVQMLKMQGEYEARIAELTARLEKLEGE